MRSTRVRATRGKPARLILFGGLALVVSYLIEERHKYTLLAYNLVGREGLKTRARPRISDAGSPSLLMIILYLFGKFKQGAGFLDNFESSDFARLLVASADYF